MAFISNCPRCQKPVLVPEGHGHDAVVQCPACFVEYSLGEILSSVPELIVVHPGAAPATAVGVTAPAPAAEPTPMGESLFAADFAQASPHDSGALDFIAEAAKVAPSEAHDIAFAEDSEHSAADALFAAAISAESPHEADAEAFAAPVEDGEFHDPSAPASAQDDNWGGDWGSFGDDVTHTDGEEAAIGAAEADGGAEHELEHVDFAAITGTAGPATAASGDAVVPAEPPKKKKRKREANLALRLIGIVVAGLLSVPCVWAIAGLAGTDMSPLPAWAQWPWPKKQAAKPPRVPQPVTPVQPDATDANTTPGNTAPPSADTGNANNNASIANAQPPSSSGAGPATPVAGNPPEVGPSGNPADAANPTKPDSMPAAPPKNEIAANGQSGPKPGVAAKEENPAPDDGFGSGPEPGSQPPGQPGKSDLGAPAVVAPVGEKPKIERPKTDVPKKPETAPAPITPGKLDVTDPFASGPDESPGKEKPKSEPKPAAPSEIKPVPPLKPDITTMPDKAGPPIEAPSTAPATMKPPVMPTPEVPTPAKPQAPAKPDLPGTQDATDPFSTPPSPAPANDKPKSEPKPELPAPAKPGTPVKPEAPNKPDSTEQPTKPPVIAPVIEPPKTEPLPVPAKPDVAAPIPAKPDIAGPTIPDPIKPEAIKPEPLKPVPIKPVPVTPEPKRAGVGPLNARTISSNRVDTTLIQISAAAEPAYSDLCQLAEAATFAHDVSAAQKQAVQDAAKKLAANSQAFSRIAGQAKKLLDDKATKGGIVLAGRVSATASKNGLFGTAIRMEGMPSAIMVFSSHPLDVKESQTVLVLGALVSDPAKNLPGYPGKQPVVVWAEFAVATP